MIKRVRLCYKPAAKRTGEEAAFVVSAEHVAAINKSIEKKLKKNKRERRERKRGWKIYCKMRWYMYLWVLFFDSKNPAY